MVNASARPAFVKKLSKLAIVLSVVVSSSAPTKQAIPRASKALGVPLWSRIVFTLWNSSEVSGLSPSLMNSIPSSLQAFSDSSSPPRLMETRHSFSATDVVESNGRVSEYGRRIFSNSSKASIRMKPLANGQSRNTQRNGKKSSNDLTGILWQRSPTSYPQAAPLCQIQQMNHFDSGYNLAGRFLLHFQQVNSTLLLLVHLSCCVSPSVAWLNSVFYRLISSIIHQSARSTCVHK
mmetsp:Transcript_20589/g.83554  ORF Transcript_20589/g.83554 Transcript_20589/m.83554 type:complete len:235 (-) Transcript_20589:33-737(-)